MSKLKKFTRTPYAFYVSHLGCPSLQLKKCKKKYFFDKKVKVKMKKKKFIPKTINNQKLMAGCIPA